MGKLTKKWDNITSGKPFEPIDGIQPWASMPYGSSKYSAEVHNKIVNPYGIEIEGDIMLPSPGNF